MTMSNIKMKEIVEQWKGYRNWCDKHGYKQNSGKVLRLYVQVVKQ